MISRYAPVVVDLQLPGEVTILNATAEDSVVIRLAAGRSVTSGTVRSASATVVGQVGDLAGGLHNMDGAGNQESDPGSGRRRVVATDRGRRLVRRRPGRGARLQPWTPAPGPAERHGSVALDPGAVDRLLHRLVALVKTQTTHRSLADAATLLGYATTRTCVTRPAGSPGARRPSSSAGTSMPRTRIR